MYGAPEVVWLSTTHDFGAFDEATGVATCTFEGVNTGDAPLVVLSARANCGCTTPRFSDSPVMPGDTVRVVVGYDASGRPGRFSKNVVVSTNAVPSKTTLVVTGTVIGSAATLQGRYPVDGGAMWLRTSVLSYGDVPRTATGGQYIECYNASADTLRPTVVSRPSYISAIVSPSEVPPGENFVISTVFDPVVCGQWDEVTDTLTVEAAGRRITLTARATVKEDFSHMTTEQLYMAPVASVAPEVLDAGRISVTGKPVKLTLTIANKGRSAMKLRRVYTTDGALRLRLPKSDEVKPGKTVSIGVEINPSMLAMRDMLNSRIIVVTNAPSGPRTSVRVVGEVIK